MPANINRRKLNSLNLIKICDLISSPPVPMALRLSGHLLAGIAFVYHNKVKLLLDDAQRLLLDFNRAWKLNKSNPKKTKSKYKSVTWPPLHNEDLMEEDNEPPLLHANTTKRMKLDNVNLVDLTLTLNLNLNQNQQPDHHQVEIAKITLHDEYNPFQTEANTATLDHMGRFDVEGDDYDEETQFHFIPLQLSNSSDSHLEQLPAGGKDQRRIARRRARSLKSLAMMYDQTTSIPAKEYESLCNNVSDIKRERKAVGSKDALSLMKIDDVIELPCFVRIEKLVTDDGQVDLTEELLRVYNDPIEIETETMHVAYGKQVSSIEKQRASTAVHNYDKEMPFGILTGELRSNNRFRVTTAKTPIPITTYSDDARPTNATPTQKHPVLINQPQDMSRITDSIRKLYKAHFEAPNNAKLGSLDQFARGMNRESASSLFYQTCVLATRDEIRVEQKLPYGDILISRGPNMHVM